MNARALLTQARAVGVALWRDAGGGLGYDGPPDAVDALLPALAEAKAELLALLTGPPDLPPGDLEALNEARAERAAIMEFDGGLPRPHAEAEAAAEVRVYSVQIITPGKLPAERETEWFTLIAPGADLAQAQQIAINQFGPARVLAVEIANQRFAP